MVGGADRARRVGLAQILALLRAEQSGNLQIRDLTSLFAALRRNQHAIVRAYGLMFDPATTVDELLAIEEVVANDLIRIARSDQIYGTEEEARYFYSINREFPRLSKLFSEQAVIGFINGRNQLLACIGMHHPSIQIEVLLNILIAHNERAMGSAVCYEVIDLIDLIPNFNEAAEQAGLWEKIWENKNMGLLLLMARHHGVPQAYLQKIIGRFGKTKEPGLSAYANLTTREQPVAISDRAPKKADARILESGLEPMGEITLEWLKGLAQESAAQIMSQPYLQLGEMLVVCGQLSSRDADTALKAASELLNHFNWSVVEE